MVLNLLSKRNYMGSKAVCPIKRNIIKKINAGIKIELCQFRDQCNRHDKSNCIYAQNIKNVRRNRYK